MSVHTLHCTHVKSHLTLWNRVGPCSQLVMMEDSAPTHERRKPVTTYKNVHHSRLQSNYIFLALKSDYTAFWYCDYQYHKCSFSSRAFIRMILNMKLELYATGLPFNLQMQSVALTLPAMSVVRLFGQVRQESCPELGWYVPTGHNKHWAWSVM